MITELGSLSILFSISSNIVSRAKESTSYHSLLSLSIQDIISMTSGLPNLIWEYFFAEPNENVSLIILPLSAFTCFFNKNLVGIPASLSKISTSLRSYELETLKLTSSSVLNVVPVLFDKTWVPPFTFKAYL